MQNQKLAIKIGNYLYNHCYGLYKLIYPVMKNRQDAYEISLMKSSIKSGDTVLDIGANIGFMSRVLSKCVGVSGCVYAFEPDAENYMHLEKALKSFSNVKTIRAAVSDRQGVITVYKSPMLNVDHRTYPVDDYTAKEDVSCVAIDEFLPKDTAVTFIKIDIQGFEYTALQGMRRTLEQNGERLKMIMELWPAGLKKAGASALQVFDFLTQLGYNLYLIEQKKMSLLTREQVVEKNDLPDDIYFNIFVRRG
jgi:FkbM family methyltransferase